MQWAAVKTQVLLMMEPPQKPELLITRAAWKGNWLRLATEPPTILDPDSSEG